MAGILNKHNNVLLENSLSSHREEDDYGGYSNLRDEVSNCDTEDSTFLNEDDSVVEEENGNKLFGDDWEWGQWTAIGDDDDDIPGPPMNDSYNGRHGFKPKIASCFDTILQCVFNYTAMNCEFFQRLSCQ